MNDKNIPEEIKGDYPLIPMNEITDEARKIAVAWYDGVSELNDIREKHKLASDIMNYAKKHTAAAIREFSLSTDESELSEKKILDILLDEIYYDFEEREIEGRKEAAVAIWQAITPLKQELSTDEGMKVWNRVEERLPEIFEDYSKLSMVTDGEEYGVGYYCESKREWISDVQNITHWQRLFTIHESTVRKEKITKGKIKLILKKYSGKPEEWDFGFTDNKLDKACEELQKLLG